MFFLLFFLALILSLILTPLARSIALHYKVQDLPSPPLKNHSKSTPLLGGVGIFLSFILTVISMTFVKSQLNDIALLTGIVLGAFWLIIGGVLDDKYSLAPKYQVIWPVLAVLTVISAGLGQDNITNPLYYLGLSQDPLFHLEVWTINVFNTEITLFTDIFTFLWLFLLIYATKFLDGLNGLVSGITAIGALLLFFTSLSLGQPMPAILSLIVAGAYLGFLPFNFFGKIFLGESGSTLAGFLLGVLAILGPAKISIIFLILGIPILDALWVVYERLFRAKKSPFKGDLRHLHFKLTQRGLTSRQSVLLLWLVSLVFGLLGLLFQGIGHILLLAGLVVLMIVLVRLTRKRTGLKFLRDP
jgi:UDP-GlcNAc:undecaprenyl-phosphate GlcNAc-1-phosphate transferase